MQIERGRAAGVLGIGRALPTSVVTNDDLARVVNTSDEWVYSRTGIRERRVVGADESTATLATAAGRMALWNAGIASDQVDMVVCATCTSDYIWPATACLVQAELGATRAAAFDLSAACSGFCYGLSVAAAMVSAGTARYVLLIGADTLTRHLNWSDRATCVLFGDGAGAAVVGLCEDDAGVLASSLGSDGQRYDAICLPYGGTRHPLTPELIAEGQDKLQMKGSEVFKFAVRIMGEVCLDALSRAGMSAADVDLFIPHQANIRIINAAAHRMNIAEEKVFTNVHKYGNTSAASVPIAMAEAVEQGRVKAGDVLVLVGFGAGLTWGANVIRWSRRYRGAEGCA